MKNLYYKEWKLVALPIIYIFMLLVLLLFIPGYPYTVCFFYISLGIFLSMLTARENKDVLYMSTLPISKRDVVRARYAFVLTIEGIQLLLSAVIIVVRTIWVPYENVAGIDANITLLGAGFVLFALFNWVFLGGYFKDVYKVNISFVKAIVAVFAFILVAEGSVHAAKAVLGTCFWDSMTPADQWRQLPILLAGILTALLISVVRYRIDCRHFEKQDL